MSSHESGTTDSQPGQPRDWRAPNDRLEPTARPLAISFLFKGQLAPVAWLERLAPTRPSARTSSADLRLLGRSPRFAHRQDGFRPEMTLKMSAWWSEKP